MQQTREVVDVLDAADFPVPETLTPEAEADYIAADHVVDGNVNETAGVWADSDSSGIVVGAVDQASAASLESDLVAAGVSDFDVQIVEHSAAELNDITETVYDVPALDAVSGAWQDWKNNRTVLTVENPTDEQLAAITEQYGDAVVVEDAPPIRAMDSRDEDSSSLYAGSRWGPSRWGDDLLGICTAAWGWRPANSSSITATKILTAGHCLPKDRTDTDIAVNDFGGSDGDYNYWLGASSPSNSTFRSGTGTVDGNGDLAMILMSDLHRTAYPRMWTGDWNSTTSRVVTGVKKWAVEGDTLCVSGAKTGSNCGYTVTATDSTYTDDGETMRQMVHAKKGGGQCTVPGDSGGAVYRRIGDTQAAAFGVLSGGSGGGDDGYIGSAESAFVDCKISFTVIGQAYQQWPTGEVLIYD